MGTVVTKLAFLPPPPTYTDQGLKWLHTSRGHQIPAIFVKKRGARFTILYSHGNAEDLGLIADHVQELSDVLNINVCAFDYTGYGLTKGIASPGEKNAYADMAAAYRFLVESCDIPPSQIIVMGRSLGSGPAVDIVSKNCVRGLILQSPLSSAVRVAAKVKFTLPFDIFPNIDKIHRVRCPVFIMHGDNDEVVPFQHGKDLYEKCRKDSQYEPFWVAGGGHNDLELNWRDEFFERLDQFFLHLQNSEPASAASNVAPFNVSEGKSSRGLSCLPGSH